MRTLSRYAESLFWLARYLERGASLARVIEMQSSYGGYEEERGWSWLLTLHADEARFAERHEYSPGRIVEFYILDADNPGSVRSSLHWARENARVLRPYMPLEMWVQLNAFHARLQELGPEDIEPSELPRTCSEIRAGCLAQIGTAEGTLYRDDGYLFFKLGLLIERADQTSRLLDVKFAQAAANAPIRTPADEFVFWATILRTASAFQAFRRLVPTLAAPGTVSRFLIHNASHPRSIAFCVREIESALHELRDSFKLAGASAALEQCEVLHNGLQKAAADPRLEGRLHEFNDWVQRSLNGLSQRISDSFFRRSADTPSDQPAAPAAGQSQSQS